MEETPKEPESEPNALEEFLANVQHEGEDALTPEQDNQETETPVTPPVETKPEEESPASSEAGTAEADNTQSESKIPFHQHPRWIERENELKELRSFKDKAEPVLSSLTAQPTQTAPIPTWFKGIYGEDQAAWADYQSYHRSEREQIKAETIAELQAKAAKEQETVTAAQKQMDDALASLEAEGKKFDRNELIKVVSDYKPIDDAGNWDFKKAYEILELQRKANSQKSTARKELAASTTSESKGEPIQDDAWTPDRLKKYNPYA